ncbi:catalase-related domain-containing protein [Verrucomicrobium spinosum]|uniref:catalase-related domain-containing protein n=1 Tax=Verrucomicrobium spinosum TaxID=2736 RepID=UPI0001745DD4|nr:catalase-related domain-containing protein [Verrucomicrobium spinosum]
MSPTLALKFAPLPKSATVAAVGENEVFSQPGHLFRFMTADLQKRLFGNIARLMGELPREVQLRQICDLFRTDPSYGIGLANALGFSVPRALSQRRSLHCTPAPTSA